MGDGLFLLSSMFETRWGKVRRKTAGMEKNVTPGMRRNGQVEEGGGRGGKGGSGRKCKAGIPWVTAPREAKRHGAGRCNSQGFSHD